jgi:trigger factor
MMGYEIVEKSGNTVLVRFTAESAVVSGIFGRVRAKVNRELRIPGFRPGHVPRNIIDQRFGNIVRAEVADDLRETLAASMLDEQDWVLSGRDTAEEDLLPVENEDFVFEQKFTLFELEAPDGYSGMELKLPRFDADVAVEKTLDGIRWKLVDYRKVDRTSQDRDLVLVEAERPNGGHEPEKMALRIGQADLGAGLDDLLTGRNPGDAFTARIEFEPGVDGAESGKPTRFTVFEVREPVLPELDDDLAKKAAGFDTMDAFRASIRERIEARWKVDRQEALETQVLDTLLSKTSFEPPEYMVGNLAEDFARNLEGERDEETDKALREIAARKVREFLVLRAVGLRESIGPTEEELAAEEGKSGSRSSALDRIRNRRTLEFILSKASIVEFEPGSETEPAGDASGRWAWKACEPSPAAE